MPAVGKGMEPEQATWSGCKARAPWRQARPQAHTLSSDSQQGGHGPVLQAVMNSVDC